MKPRDVVETGQSDMFHSRLNQIIDMGHEKAVLAQQIDWQCLSEKNAVVPQLLVTTSALSSSGSDFFGYKSGSNG